jgi:hypothetical protein
MVLLQAFLKKSKRFDSSRCATRCGSTIKALSLYFECGECMNMFRGLGSASITQRICDHAQCIAFTVKYLLVLTAVIAHTPRWTSELWFMGAPSTMTHGLHRWMTFKAALTRWTPKCRSMGHDKSYCINAVSPLYSRSSNISLGCIAGIHRLTRRNAGLCGELEYI